MTKITKKEFKNILTNNKSIFFGLTTNKKYYDDELNLFIDNFIETNSIVEQRTATETSNGLKFCNGSHVSVSDTKCTKCTCYKLEYKNYTMLELETNYYSEYDNTTTTKRIFYLV